MIFLIEYNRPEGRIVSFQAFDESQRRQAQEARLQLELERNREGIDHEIVLLEATSEEALRKTHGRYFESIEEIGESLKNIGK
jgi:hypothetical protein